MQELTCKTCLQDWTRPPQRGRPPNECPDCKAGVVKQVKPKDVDTGHVFEDFEVGDKVLVTARLRKYGNHREEFMSVVSDKYEETQTLAVNRVDAVGAIVISPDQLEKV